MSELSAITCPSGVALHCMAHSFIELHKALRTVEEQRDTKGKGERERYIQLNTEFQRIARREKKAFFNEQCLIIEENNKRGKTKDLFRKIGNIKAEFHPKMGTIKDKNCIDLVDAEAVMKTWK